MIRLLVADAQGIVRMGIKQLCRELGDFMVTAEANCAGLVLAQLESMPFDMVVIEPDMPGEGGARLVETIHSRWASLPILAFSGYCEPFYARKVLNEGASGFLAKDCEPEMLAAALRKIAAGERFISHEIAFRMMLENKVERPVVRRDIITPREMQVLQLYCQGMSIQEIAQALSISNRTVSTHKTKLMQKMNFRSNVDLYCYALESGLLNPNY